jgi:hypothetical protein
MGVGTMQFCEIVIKTAGEQGAGGMEKEPIIGQNLFYSLLS